MYTAASLFYLVRERQIISNCILFNGIPGFDLTFRGQTVKYEFWHLIWFVITSICNFNICFT